MSLFGRRKGGTEIQPGDVFHKVGTYGGDWVVQRIFEYPDIPRHARLVEKTGARAMTVAVSLLTDPDNFTPVRQAAASEE